MCVLRSSERRLHFKSVTLLSYVDRPILSTRQQLGATGDMSVRDYFSVRKKPFDAPPIDKAPQPDIGSLPAPPPPSVGTVMA